MSTTNVSHPAHVRALTALYASTGGEKWQQSTRWFQGDPCNADGRGTPWFGIECQGQPDDRSIRNINLRENNLLGTLPTQIGDLASIAGVLALRTNNLYGYVPTEIGLLRTLWAFDLHECQLSGTIPSEIGDMTGIGAPALHTNFISGTAPTELARLTWLTHFWFYNNDISGTLPALNTPGLYQHLSSLRVEANRLSGTIPLEFYRLPSITVVHLNGNRFSGTLSGNVSKFRDLTELSVNVNRLSGTLPTQLGLLSELGQLTTEYNHISGSIPSQLGNLTRLNNIQLYNNYLSGSLASELANLPGRDYCYLTRRQCWRAGNCVFDRDDNTFACPLPALSPNCAAGLVGDQFCAVTPSPPPLPSSPPPPVAWEFPLESGSVVLFLFVAVLGVLFLCMTWRWRTSERMRQKAESDRKNLLHRSSGDVEMQQPKTLVEPDVFWSAWTEASGRCTSPGLKGSTDSPKTPATSSPGSAGTTAGVAPRGAFALGVARGQTHKGADLRYAAEDPSWLLTGRPSDAARGLKHTLRVDHDLLHERLVHGVQAIRREFEDHGTDEDKECLEYVLKAPAGSSDKVFPNGVRDSGRQGETLDDFVNHEHAQLSSLSRAHVVALRLYTSAAYKSLNAPLRDLQSRKPHPFPVTMWLIAEGLRQLRTIAANEEGGATAPLDLWRGMKNVVTRDAFQKEGGTEVAPTSTTTSLKVAVRYAHSPHSLIFKIKTTSFMDRGVDLSFLSCFPEECEHLYPPLTYLKPTGRTQDFKCPGGETVTIVEVTATYGS